ncbi:MAG TPA: 3-hydroxyacyl-CoA dehydrogenase NAD-binding domain-containing protein [Vicinamibacterales bacterium]|nr:3-hydroxyacyl-CoA dehydrogenase NAD-binding domain-containing protein [Vicinamibacterales bacterium]
MPSASPRLRSVCVLGAGTMGAQIAAHLCNAGYPVSLLDISAAAAREGLDRARKLKPDPFFTPDTSRLIRTGGFDTDLAWVADADWIIEAIIEQAEAKRSLLARVDELRRPGSIVSSNTSGLSIAGLAEGRSDDFRKHWLGTHFFNPPRYLPLLEIIPTAETDPAVVTAIRDFADRRLGKNVVVAKDTPGFIANHVAMHGLVRIFEALASGAYTVEEIDAITGAAVGRPKSATFRTVDIAGLDILVHVANDLAARLPHGRGAQFRFPPFVQEMLSRGWIGEKAGRGFYERRKDDAGDTDIWALDPQKMEYRPRQPVKLPSLDTVAPLPLPERMRKLFSGKDRVGEFLQATLPGPLRYVAEVAPEIAYSIDDIDRAMQWGYGWSLGPFELADAIGLNQRPHRTAPLGVATPEFDILRSARDRQTVVASNAGASLIDLGDGVLAVSLHSKMNAIGGDALEMLQRGVREASENFTALVVAGEGPNFSVGANLMLLLLEAQEGNWEDIDAIIRAFQKATTGLRYSEVPVVVAPFALTLGGGCEIVLHGDRVRAAAEAYIGLVEVGVGLIPAAGGTKEMLLRLGPEKAFETIGFAKTSTSAPEARRLGYLRDVDSWTMNRDRLVFDAKQIALKRVQEGYRPPARPTEIPVGGDPVRATLDLGVHLAWRAGRISDHDAVIGRKLSWILAGGSLPHAGKVSEDQLLDLEREAFLSLCGEAKTLERIQYTLKTGKTLRN